jgi:uncharacterized protein (TIGR00266 family)
MPTESTPRVETFGSSSFKLLQVTLLPSREIIAEAGAMASMDSKILISSELNGGLLKALLAKFIGNETLFINRFINITNEPGTVFLTQPTPGDVIEHELHGESLFIESGSLIARTSGINVGISWAGFGSWIAGEGLFRLRITGQGRIWYGCFGAAIEREVIGDMIVDSGHLLSYPPSVKLRIKTPGGLISSFLSKEGFVLSLSGKGKVRLQTRSIKGLAQWLNPRFWA